MLSGGGKTDAMATFTPVAKLCVAVIALAPRAFPSGAVHGRYGLSPLGDFGDETPTSNVPSSTSTVVPVMGRALL